MSIEFPPPAVPSPLAQPLNLPPCAQRTRTSTVHIIGSEQQVDLNAEGVRESIKNVERRVDQAPLDSAEVRRCHPSVDGEFLLRKPALCPQLPHVPCKTRPSVHAWTDTRVVRRSPYCIRYGIEGLPRRWEEPGSAKRRNAMSRLLLVRIAVGSLMALLAISKPATAASLTFTDLNDSALAIEAFEASKDQCPYNDAVAEMLRQVDSFLSRKAGVHWQRARGDAPDQLTQLQNSRALMPLISECDVYQQTMDKAAGVYLLWTPPRSAGLARPGHIFQPPEQSGTRRQVRTLIDPPSLVIRSLLRA